MMHHRHPDPTIKPMKSWTRFGSLFRWTLLLSLFQGLLIPISGHSAEQRSNGTPSPHYRADSTKTVSNPHGSDAHFSKSLERQLDLNAEQAGAFEKIETAYRVMTIRKGADIRVAEVELAALLEDEKPNLELIKQKIAAIGTLRTELMAGRVDSLLQLRSVLTKEQHDRFRHILRERMEQMTNHHARLMTH